MADKLIIVESPAKANTIKKFLGGSTKVVASMGHIRDLPKSKLGVNVEKDFEPEYINIRGKGDLIKSLKKDAKAAKKVYLATDPDREGEAIAWHLEKILHDDAKDITRVTFNEITKGAVQKAIKNTRTLTNSDWNTCTIYKICLFCPAPQNNSYIKMAFFYFIKPFIKIFSL